MRLLLSAALILTSIAISGVAGAVERVELCEMSAAIRDVEPDPARRVARIRAYLADKQVAVVNGYLGCSPTEFRDVHQTLQNLGVNIPLTSICPPSRVAIEANVGYILKSLRTIAARSPDRKIVLLGQSKGGAEILQFLATHPEVMTPKSKRGFEVAAAVTFSAAIGGSVMADIVLNTDPELTQRWEDFKRVNGGFVRALAKSHFDPTTPGFQSLTTPRSKARNQRLLKETSEETRRLLAEKLYFVTAVRDGTSNDVPDFLTLIAKFMHQQTDANDCLVYEKDQRLDGLGTHLLEVKRASHFSLIGSHGKAECRQELAHLLFLKLAVSQSTLEILQK